MKIPYTIKFDEDLLEKLKKEAKQNHLPFNRYVENLIKTHQTRVK